LLSVEKHYNSVLCRVLANHCKILSPLIVFVCRITRSSPSVWKSLTVFRVDGAQHWLYVRVRSTTVQLFVKYLYNNIVSGVFDIEQLFTVRLQQTYSDFYTFHTQACDRRVFLRYVLLTSIRSTYNKSSYALMRTFFYATSGIFCRLHTNFRNIPLFTRQ